MNASLNQFTLTAIPNCRTFLAGFDTPRKIYEAQTLLCNLGMTVATAAHIKELVEKSEIPAENFVGGVCLFDNNPYYISGFGSDNYPLMGEPLSPDTDISNTGLFAIATAFCGS